MPKKAVLVGCNYPDTSYELWGCVNDVMSIRRSLLDRFGFAERDITILIDTDGRCTQPTGAHIKHALHNLVTDARPGDVLFFHYSGHGVRLPIPKGANDTTGYDECIVPIDMNLITDDDFREIVDKVPQGVTFTFVSDSCHSGGLINNAKEQIGESTTQQRDRGIRHELKLKFHGYMHHRHRDYKDSDEDRVNANNYESLQGDGKSRSLPLSMLIEILKQKTGNDDLDADSVRPTLFDMFGKDSSLNVKKFVKYCVQGILQKSDGASLHGSGIGTVSNSALKLLKHKLKRLRNPDDYFKPAYDTPNLTKMTYRDMGILVSGCQSYEISADTSPTGQRCDAHGAMSNALQTFLSQHEQPVNNYQLVTGLRDILKRQGFKQQPGLYCSDENAYAPFIC